MQKVIAGNGSIQQLKHILNTVRARKVMIVCSCSYQFLPIKEQIDNIQIPIVFFDDFTPNPQYADVAKGVHLFNAEGCDTLLAVGGGSSIDVAKCIKLYCKMDETTNFLQQEYKDTGIPLIAIPTTAGTGSESTRYAVIYYNGEKQSVTHQSLIPEYAILEPSVLKTLPFYQKTCTLMDALCQGIESWWSVNSTETSKKLSQKAVETIMKNYKAYLFKNDDHATTEIFLAANYAGQAINITQTTSAHAMSYKITSLYGLPHGHAVAICLPYIWAYMHQNLDLCIDRRGKSYLASTFEAIAKSLGCENVDEAVCKFSDLLNEIGLEAPCKAHVDDLPVLSASVNLTRLNNNPVKLETQNLYDLYILILKLDVK
ncbi:MAG: phosphonoacetaldehyde reductase [Clostridia bacterium]|nr:phosphonoacetaldehyde reductase [Clostridia bacterium]